MPRVLVGSIQHEVHSFVPGTTDLDAFERGGIHVGPAMLRDLDGSELGGAAAVARDRGITLVPTLRTHGGSGPRIEANAYDQIETRLLDLARSAGPVDGVFLSLHGAMATTDCDDPEARLVHRVRAVVGPSIPVVVSHDLHAHVTDAILGAANAVVGYRTCPHTDIAETGARAMEVLADTLAGRIRPVTRRRRLSVMTSAEAHDTTDGPLAHFQARARELEAEPGVVSVAIFATQPWMDVAGVGWSVVVVTDDDASLAQDCADRLAEELWAARSTYAVTKTPVVEALEIAVRHRNSDGVAVLADGADSPSAGSRGDSVALLTEMVRGGSDLRGLMVVTDPRAVDIAAAAGAGSDIDLDLGATLSPNWFEPVHVHAHVVRITGGSYRSQYPPVRVDAGRTAVLEVASQTVVVTENPVMQLDLEPYRRLGLDPVTYDLVQVKSAGGYRAYWAPIASVLVDMDTRGPCDSELTQLPYRNITRPLWPFDPDLERPW